MGRPSFESSSTAARELFRFRCGISRRNSEFYQDGGKNIFSGACKIATVANETLDVGRTWLPDLQDDVGRDQAFRLLLQLQPRLGVMGEPIVGKTETEMLAVRVEQGIGLGGGGTAAM